MTEADSHIERHEALLRASPARALTGHIAVPGDKSISHRALILGALASGETRIEGLLEGEDVLHTAAAVRALGAAAERLPDGTWLVRGGRWRSPGAPIDCGNSGTGARLLMGAVAGQPIEATFTGDESLRSRPMKRVLDPLRAMGAGAEGDDRLPVTVRGGSLRGIAYRNDEASAQVKSAILLAGLGAEGRSRCSNRSRAATIANTCFEPSAATWKASRWAPAAGSAWANSARSAEPTSGFPATLPRRPSRWWPR